MAELKKVTTLTLQKMKKEGEKIACLTAYDWLLASILDESGLDVILVGDSGSMVFAGHDSTLPITMDQMIYHSQCVSRGVRRALCIADMPFMSYQTSPEEALRNAGRFMKEGLVDGVKLEGGEPMAETIRFITDRGIPVMGHLGLTPQSVQLFGGYRVRGKSDKEAREVFEHAKIVQEAGAFAIVLEKIPTDLAKDITGILDIPTIGIGAGPHCDGQILVTPDMLGLFDKFKPKFVRQYAHLKETLKEAFQRYASDIKSMKFPSEEECF